VGAPEDAIVTVALNFPPGGVSADDLDLSNLPARQTPTGLVLDIAWPAGITAVQVRIPTRVDDVSPEGIGGVEQFSALAIETILGGVARSIAAEQAPVAPILLQIQDVAGASAPTATSRTRIALLNRGPDQVLPAVQGPLVAGAVVVAPSGDELQLHLPPALRVWLSPGSAVQIKQGSTVLASATGAPATISVSPTGSTELTLEGRLRNGAPYREVIDLPAPS